MTCTILTLHNLELSQQIIILPTPHPLNMRFSSILAAFATISGVQGYVVEMYSEANCKEEMVSRNIWDYSCANNLKKFKSFKIAKYGGMHQRGYIGQEKSCDGLKRRKFWADKGGKLQDECQNVTDLSSKEETTAESLESWYDSFGN